MKPPFQRTQYNYDMNKAGDESGLKCEDPSLTHQSFADEVDINTIVRRFNLTGQLPTNVHMPTYQDFEGIFDYHTAMNAIAQAHESFDTMPADVRARFHNDPAEFIDFCSNTANREEAIKLGLVAPAAAALTGGTPRPSEPGNAPGATTEPPKAIPEPTPPTPPKGA